MQQTHLAADRDKPAEVPGSTAAFTLRFAPGHVLATPAALAALAQANNLLAFLRQRQVQANLIDPPDIVAELGFGPYGIACKKVYSERGVEAQMRKGAKQLLPFQGHGLIALNLDDLAPSETLLRSESKETASAYLHQFNLDFVERHRRVLQRFIMDGKCNGILVSTTTPSDIEHSETRLNTFTQTALWTLNEISLGARLRIGAVGQTITRR